MSRLKNSEKKEILKGLELPLLSKCPRCQKYTLEFVHVDEGGLTSYAITKNGNLGKGISCHDADDGAHQDIFCSTCDDTVFDIEIVKKEIKLIE